MKVIGQAIERIGAKERVQGKTEFSADLRMEGLLHLKVVRSKLPHAEIVSIDTSKAESLPGVKRVFTAKDIPGKNLYGIITKDQTVLAEDKVRFVGDPIALVVAETEEISEKAAELVKIEYRELPPIFDPEEAMQDNAPRIHEKGNLLFTRRIRKGDVDKGFQEADVIIEDTYETSMLEHSAIEVEAGVGYMDEEGRIVIKACTQNPHYDHTEVCSILGLSPEKVRIIQAETGGGFGGKLDISVQPFLGLAVYHLKQPVKLVYTREESFLCTAKRHPLKIRMKTGAKKDGTIVAMEGEIICDTGAYASYAIATATRAAVHLTGPYNIPNVSITSHAVYTNNPWAGAMRGFGVPQIAIAHEGQMDRLAEALGMDRWEIRYKNAFDTGSITATGQKLEHSVGIKATLEAVKTHFSLLKKEADKFNLRYKDRKRGVGIACMWYGIGNTGHANPAYAKIAYENGNFVLYTGAADIGQGSDTILLQIAAEVLEVDPFDIKLVRADTLRTLNAGATSASRQTYISGNAVKIAAEELKRKISDGSHKDIDEPIESEGYFDPEITMLDPETGQGIPYTTYAFATQVNMIEVDLVTGYVKMIKAYPAHDVGKAVNPDAVKGQIYSGVAMGFGMATMEEFIPGVTTSLDKYMIPVPLDMPEVEPIIVEVPEPSGPFGAKGVGEPALIPTAPAILGGIKYAIGRWINKLPASLERVKEVCPKLY